MSAVLDALENWAAADPDRIALYGHDRAWTYRALRDDVAATALRLEDALGDGAPARPVAMDLDNGPAWVVIDLALMRLGRPALPLPAFFTADQRAHALADSGAGWILDASQGDVPVADALVRVRRTMAKPVSLPEGVAKITYTSGSTGAPKGVCLSLDQMEATARALVQVLGANLAGRHLPVLPLAVLLENVAGLYPILLAGGAYDVLPPSALGLCEPFRPDLARLAQTIGQRTPTSLILVPELLRALIMVMGFTGAKFPHLRLVAVGGAKVAPALLADAAAVGLPVVEGYGLTECASVLALNTPADNLPGAVGRPLPHLKVALSPEGEIQVGPRPFLGYAGHPPQTGPYATGDLARFDAFGRLVITGRRSNTIISAFGRNIAPEWVESELLAEPLIRQAIVYGEGQPHLSALLVPLSPEVDEATLQAVVDRANDRLPAYAQVKTWRRRGPLDPERGEITGNGRPRRQAILDNLELEREGAR